jgi:hypothetical protein
MSLAARTSFVLAVGLAASAGIARGQETQGKDPQPPAPAPAPSPAPKRNADELLQQMATLYPRAISRPATSPVGADLEKRGAVTRADDEWKRAVKALAKTGDEYVSALDGAAPAARGLYYRGVGKLLATTLDISAADRAAYLAAAADAFRSYLGVAGEKDAFVADAELHLSEALISMSSNDGKALDEAPPHIERAVALLQKDGRADEAGVLAATSLRQYVSLGRTSDASKLAEAIHAADGDFGTSTPVIRAELAAARVVVGAKMPALPAVKDVDGKEIDLAAHKGSPLLLHFFLTGQIDGSPTGFRDVEIDLRPLWDKFHEKGLRIVGVAMDHEMPKEEAAETRRKWEEWGRSVKPRDGSLATCRTWADEQGIAWPWMWDGKWQGNPISAALGGVGLTAPHAILVDGDGVIRWNGDAQAGEPQYPGLADEVAKLVAK